MYFPFYRSLVWLLLLLLITQSTFIPADNPPPTSPPYFTYPVLYFFHFHRSPSSAQAQHCWILHTLSSSEVQFIAPLLHAPTLLSLWFSTPTSLLSVWIHKNTGSVWLFVHGSERVRERRQPRAIAAIHIRLPEERVGGSAAMFSFSFLPVTLKLLCSHIEAQWKCQSERACMLETPDFYSISAVTFVPHSHVYTINRWYEVYRCSDLSEESSSFFCLLLILKKWQRSNQFRRFSGSCDDALARL